MKRFAKAFLTVSVGLILLINLGLILLYGRQFYACSNQATSSCLALQKKNWLLRYQEPLLINGIVVGTLLLLWVSGRSILVQERRN